MVFNRNREILKKFTKTQVNSMQRAKTEDNFGRYPLALET